MLDVHIYYLSGLKYLCLIPFIGGYAPVPGTQYRQMLGPAAAASAAAVPASVLGQELRVHIWSFYTVVFGQESKITRLFYVTRDFSD